jgi:hypothetical protein
MINLTLPDLRTSPRSGTYFRTLGEYARKMTLIGKTGHDGNLTKRLLGVQNEMLGPFHALR